jgi:hypothetical protein
MRHKTEVPDAQKEKHTPGKLFRFENDHIIKNILPTTTSSRSDRDL